jgi:hypothetical protein
MREDVAATWAAGRGAAIVRMAATSQRMKVRKILPSMRVSRA